MIQVLQIMIRYIDLKKMLTSLVATLYRWQVQAEQRRRLGDLDQHALDDIGISRGQAKAEARKPFFWT